MRHKEKLGQGEDEEAQGFAWCLMLDLSKESMIYLLNITIVPVVIESVLQVPINGAAESIFPINLFTPPQGCKLFVADEVASAQNTSRVKQLLGGL
jgi:TRAP-type C4-dicarboxylate transport system permease large subunit